MKKKLLILVTVLIVIFIALSIAAYFQLNSIIALLKPQIESQITQLSGGTIKINEIKANLFPQVGLELKDLEFAKPGLTAAQLRNVKVSLELMPLLSKNVKVKELTVDGEKVELVLPNFKSPFTINNLKLKTSVTAKTDALDLSDLSVETTVLNKIPFKLNTGNINLVIADKSGDIKDISLNFGGIPLKLSSLGFSLPTKNITAKGVNTNFNLSVLPEILATFFEKGFIPVPPLVSPKGSLKFNGDYAIAGGMIEGQGKASLSDFAVALLGNSVEALSLTSEHKVGGNAADITTRDISLVAKSGSFQNGTPISLQIPQLANKITFDNLNISYDLKDLVAKINEESLNLSSQGNFQGQNLKVNNYAMSGFGGTASGTCALNLRDKSFEVTSSAKTLSIPGMLRLIKFPNQNIKGEVTALAANLSGSLADPMGSSSGTVNAQLKDTYIEGINFVKSVFKEINAIPLIGEIVKAGLPPSINAAMQSEITPINDLKADVVLNSGTANIRKVDMLSDLFTLNGSGTYGLTSKSVKFSTMFLLKKDVTDQLASRVKELRYGVNEAGLLEIPLSLSGTIPTVIALPNVAKIAERAASGVVKEKAKDAVKDILDKKTGGMGGKLLDGILGGF